MSDASVPPPSERFNFARHLLALNVDRAAKVAYLDDFGPMTYGELDDRTRRFASALSSVGSSAADTIAACARQFAST